MSYTDRERSRRLCKRDLLARRAALRHRIDSLAEAAKCAAKAGNMHRFRAIHLARARLQKLDRQLMVELAKGP